AGAVGCNLEDSDHKHPGTLLDAGVQARRLAAFKAAARTAGVDVVLNARVDVFVRQLGEPDSRVPEAIRRARLYVEAGADCIFPIVVRDEADVAVLLGAIPAPVNILALEGGPHSSRLREMGVARISFGGAFQRLAIADHRERLTKLQSGHLL